MPAISNFSRLFAVLACFLAVASPASAQQVSDVDQPSPYELAGFRPELVAGAAFGKTTIDTGETLNPYGPTVGLRLGYTFGFPVHLGLRYDHFFGSSSDYPVPLVALTTYRASASFIGGAAGAELVIGPAYLRPELAFGALWLRQSAECSRVQGSFDDLASQMCAANQRTESSWEGAIAPGLLMGLHLRRLHFFAEPSYFVGKNARAYSIVGGVGLAL